MSQISINTDRRGRTEALLAISLALCGFAVQAHAGIVINELMYHPYQPYPYPYYTNNTEYVEILNTGSTNVDLTGYAFDNGIQFDFPDGTTLAPGQYLVICENLHQFTNAYPTVKNVIGQYSGGLSDGGERVTLSRLMAGKWIIVDTIKYIDGGLADGLNRSLELVNPGFAHLRDEYYGSWLASLTVNGTPGIVNSRYDETPPPVVGSVEHDPPLPLPGSTVAITAHALGLEGEALANVTLKYRIDANPTNAWRQAQMHDTGKGGDAVAGDHIYTLYLPEPDDPPMTHGMMYEFTITADDTFGRSVTVPAINTADVTGPGPFSYLCGFIDDTDFTGEYTTYHILMTKLNRYLLEYGRAENSKDPIDCTFITSKGEIFYNSGVRYRGNSSLKWPYNFRIEIPRGMALDGSREWDFNYRRAMLQYLGLTITEEAGYGCHGLNAELARLWLNETDKTTAPAETPGEFHNIYVKFEPVDNDLLSKFYDGEIGNIYRGQDGNNGGLKVGTIANYQSWYLASINNPLTAWSELDALCQLLAGDASQYPSTLTNLVDVRQWARTYGVHSALSNGEGGFHCPRRTQGDDYYVHRRADTGKFVMYPWDMDEVIQHGVEGQVTTNRSIWEFESNGGPAAPVVSKFLLSEPMISYYVGDVVDVLDTVMSPSNMTAIFDGMGSILTPAYRQTLATDIASRRNFVHSQVNTNLTLAVTGAFREMNDVSFVSGTTVRLTGTAPQNYTTAVVINGITNTTWSTRQNTWSTTTDTVLTGAYNTLTVAAVDAESHTLKSIRQTVISTADNLTKGGMVTTDTLWTNPDGVLTVSSDVTITNGATLTIGAGSTVLMAPGKRVWVADGTLNIAGTFSERVHIIPSDAVSAWRVDVAAGSSVTGQYAHVSGGRVRGTGGEMTLTETTLTAYDGADGIVDVTGGGVTLYRCTVSDYALMSFVSAQVTVSECVLRNMDTLAAQFAAGTATVSRTTIEDGGSAAIGIQASQDATVTVTNSLFRRLPGKAIRIGGVSGGQVDVTGIDHGQTGWVPIGTFTFQGDGTERITLAKGPNTSIAVADAIMLTNATGMVVVDDADAGSFSLTGSWVAKNLGYAGVMQTSTDPSSTATWLLPGFAGGTYQVYASVTHWRPLPHDPEVGYTLYVNLPSSASVSLAHSLIHDCGAAVEVGLNSLSANHHATVAKCLTGISGTNCSLHSSIIWETAENFPFGTPLVTFSDLTATGLNVPPGTGNINRPPWFRDTANADYRLQPISPCIGTGLSGTDMGTSFPVGVNPATPSALIASNTVIGITNAVALTWTDTGTDTAWFDIQRTVSGDDQWQNLATVLTGTTAYLDTTVGQNTSYDYRVRAAHARGSSFYSDIATVSTRMDAAGQSLRITEIMYHPADGVSPDADDYEFLELCNVGSLPVDVSGFVIGGIGSYTFPANTVLNAGASLVLIRHPGAFSERYPGVPYFGVYSGSLSNGGERLRVYDSQGGTALDFTYSDWYPSTDGGGYSLVLADANGDLSSASSWRPGGVYSGTPGTQEALEPYARIVINEVFAHTDEPYEDAIELYNAGTTDVDIAHWYLSDGDANLTKYQITDDPLVIPAGGYHVFYETTSFNEGGSGFALSELGDAVYLTSGNGSQVTDYLTSENFGATANGTSLGRYRRSDGQIDFVPMSSPTFGVNAPSSSAEFRSGTGAPNSYPLVGPVVINEIMYNPAATGKEFVEIHSIATTNLPLFSGTNGWAFDGAFEYVFPVDTWIGPGEHIVITSIDPEEFRGQMGITNPVLKILGPFKGDLNNAGESIKLYRPGTPEPDGFVPRIRVDRVQYGDSAPWPEEADNGGPSLERVSPTAYGNDPTNWVAATVGGTPGESNNVVGMPSVAFSRSTSGALETDQTVAVTIVLIPPSASTVTVNYAVSGGTASDGTDYTLTPGSVLFWPYETTKTITLQVLDDAEPEPDETIEIELTGLSPNARYGGTRIHRHTIIDTDGTSLPAPGIAPLGTNSFTFSQAVAMSSSVPDTKIYYTLDGTTPTINDFLYSAQIILTKTAKVKARAYLGSVNASPVTTAVFLQQTPPPAIGVLNKRITEGPDDATEIVNGSMQLSQAFLQLGYYRTAAYKAVGLRFQNLAIPRGVIVSNAYVQFTATSINYPNGGPFTIRGESSGHSAAFTDELYNITGRGTTSASVSWSPPNDWLEGSAGDAQRTPDISAIVQEIVDRGDWAANNALSIILTFPSVSGYRRAQSFEGNPAKAAVLHVEFGIPGGGDADNDGMLDVWEIQHFGSTNAPNGAAGEDYDFDGMKNVSEYIAGTIPTNAQSVFELSHASPATGHYQLYWSSASGRLYAVYRSTNLLQAWQTALPLASDLPADPSGTNQYDDTTATNAAAFYRIGVRLAE